MSAYTPEQYTMSDLLWLQEQDITAEERAAIRAELARREQAQAGPSPATLGSNAAINDALMLEASQKIDELRAENERLRSLLRRIQGDENGQCVACQHSEGYGHSAWCELDALVNAKEATR